MVKVIKVHDNNYEDLLTILHKLEKERKERLSFDHVISYLMSIYKEKDLSRDT